ncbi:hypothetical protein BESB_048750 [Besnoitia besnoiti]|uniref:Ppg3 n=1 Tax=Besnoitia besnoiti TaxID=94643 RepID=A0A2A9MLS3_BESBE|nr:hypothetical protein BESB_048750 [Besnoitia besnoiti]PFH36683.1 hypothetical protein BESB_048750 [Besnoitia besnoiti]
MQGRTPRPPAPSNPWEDRTRRPVPQGWAVVQTPEDVRHPSTGHAAPGYPACGPSITPLFAPAATGVGPRPFCAEAFLSVGPVDSHRNSSAGSIHQHDSAGSGLFHGDGAGSPPAVAPGESGSGRPLRPQKSLGSLRTSTSVPHFFHSKAASLLKKKREGHETTRHGVTREGGFWGELEDEDDEAEDEKEKTSSPRPPSTFSVPLLVVASPSRAGPSLSLGGLSGTPSPPSSHRSAEGSTPAQSGSGQSGAAGKSASSGLSLRRSFFQKSAGRTLSLLGSAGGSCPDFFAQNKGVSNLSPAASVAGENDSVASSSSVGKDLCLLGGGYEESPPSSVPTLSAAGVPPGVLQNRFGGASGMRQVQSFPSLAGFQSPAEPSPSPPPSLSRIQASELEQTVGTELGPSLAAHRRRAAGEAVPSPAWPSSHASSSSSALSSAASSAPPQPQQSRHSVNISAISRRLSMLKLRASSAASSAAPASSGAKGGKAAEAGGRQRSAAEDARDTSGLFVSRKGSDFGFDVNALRVGEVSAVPEEVNGNDESGGSSAESEHSVDEGIRRRRRPSHTL